MPDDRRFGIVWMSEKALASAYDLDGAFSSVGLKLLPDVSEREVMQRLNACLSATAARRRTGARTRPRMRGSTMSSTCSTT
jgi:putative ABC transport system permease protein